MRTPSLPVPFRCVALALACAALGSCGGNAAANADGRELAWKYGPTNGGATPEHLGGSGTLGNHPIAEGWKFRIGDDRHLTVRPYKLAKEHPFFGKVTMTVGLFDKAEKRLETVHTGTITADNASFSLELGEATAKQAYDVVIWFVKA